MKITYNPMSEAPDTISGGFNFSETFYSVSKKGQLTRIAGASDCTYEGDEKVTQMVDKTIPRIAIKTVRHGNGGWEKTTYYKA